MLLTHGHGRESKERSSAEPALRLSHWLSLADPDVAEIISYYQHPRYKTSKIHINGLDK